MPKSKPYPERVADSRAATEAAHEAWRATSREFFVRNGDTDTDPDVSLAGLRQRFFADDPTVSSHDVMVADYELNTLLPDKLARQKTLVNNLKSRELTMDQGLAMAMSNAVAETLGGIPVDVCHELPSTFSPSHAPHAYVFQKTDDLRNDEAGFLSGTACIAYLRVDAHRSLPLEAEHLTAGLNARGVRLAKPARLGTTRDVGNGLSLDIADVEVRIAWPETVIFAAGHTPTTGQVEDFASGVVQRAAEHATRPGHSLGLHRVEESRIVSTRVAGGLRRVTASATLAMTPRDEHPKLTDTEYANSVLRQYIEAAVGQPANGLGRVTGTKVTGSHPARSGNTHGIALDVEFVFESVVEATETTETTEAA